MIRSGVLLISSLVMAAILAGCATIIHGPRQDIPLNTAPVGATYRIVQLGLEGSTPAVVKLPRDEKTVVIQFEKEGYEPVQVTLRRKTDGWVWGNLIFGGLIGIVIDFANGSAYKLDPKTVSIVMTESAISGLDQEHALVVVIDANRVAP